MDTYAKLDIIHIDGTKYSIPNIYKAMTVRNFKRMVGMTIKAPPAACESLKLFVLSEEMENSRTLESYQLDDLTAVRVVPVGQQASAPQPPLGLSTPLQNLARPKENARVGDTIGDAFVKVDDRTHVLNDLTMDMTADDVLRLISEKTGVHTDYLMVIYGGKQLREGTGMRSAFPL